MYIKFNYRCQMHGDKERFVKRALMDEIACESCGALMTRLPAAPKTHFRFADTKLKD